MKNERKLTKTEGILLGLTGVFLCGLLALSAYDQKAETAIRVETDRAVPQETFLPDLSPVNLNTADAEELDELPGIGEVLAGRILEYRAEHGPFRSVDDLKNIAGIGEETVAGLADRVTVDGG